MKIIAHSWYVEIWSERLFINFLRGYSLLFLFFSLKWIYSKKSRLAIKVLLFPEKTFEETQKQMYGTAFWPFLIMNPKCIEHNLIEENHIRYLLNHEKIHLRQQVELPLGLFFILKVAERWYLSKKMPDANKKEIYLNCATEQEAYLNMYNLNYLKERKLWSVFKYIRKKQKITPGKIIN